MATFDKNDDSVVVIVGSGAGGGTLGAELAMKGVKTVILEAGGRHETEDFQNDEWGSFGQISWLDKRTTSGSWRVAKDFSGLPAWIVKAVGGSTIHWAGASLRFQDHEWKAATTYGNVPGCEPARLADRLGRDGPVVRQGGRPLGVTRTTVIPGLPGNNNFKVFEAGAKKLGYKEVHTGRMAINSEPIMTTGRAASKPASASRAASGVPSGRPWYRNPAGEETGNLEVRERAQVLKIEHDDSGKVTGVLYADKDGNQHVQKARVVCVAGNSIESPRLLLNSASSMYPDGLGQLVWPGGPQLHAPHDRLGLCRVRQAGENVARHHHGRHHPG
jgi:choline dehydrogenase-like flavoprotein